MSEHMKHTPGPWSVAGRDVRNLPHSMVAADTLLARVYSKHFGDVAEEEANARLIAAAPELLAALKDVLYAPNDDCVSSTAERIRARVAALTAIARAEGREVAR